MKHSIRFTDIVLMIAIFLISGVKADDSRQLTATSLLTDQPLAFTENQGQWDEKVKFRANVGGATMWFTKDGIYYQYTRKISNDDPQRGGSTSGPTLLGGLPPTVFREQKTAKNSIYELST